MAIDKAVDSAALDAGMTATANAIRAKSGGSASIAWDAAKGFADAVAAIPTGGGGGGLLSVSAMYEIIKAQGTAFPETVEAPFPTPEGASVLYTGFKDARGNVAVYVSRIYSIPAILDTNGSVSNTSGFWDGTWSAGDDGNPVVENVKLYLPFESVGEVGVIINGIDPEVTGLYMTAATEGYYLFL